MVPSRKDREETLCGLNGSKESILLLSLGKQGWQNPSSEVLVDRDHGREEMLPGTGQRLWKDSCRALFLKATGLTSQADWWHLVGHGGEHQSVLCKSSANDSPWSCFKGRRLSPGVMAQCQKNRVLHSSLCGQQPLRTPKRTSAEFSTNKHKRFCLLFLRIKRFRLGHLKVIVTVYLRFGSWGV